MEPLCSFCANIDFYEMIFRPSTWADKTKHKFRNGWRVRTISECTKHHNNMDELTNCAFAPDGTGCRLCKTFLVEWLRSGNCMGSTYSPDEVLLPGEDDLGRIQRLTRKHGMSNALYIGPVHDTADKDALDSAGPGITLWHSQDNQDTLGWFRSDIIGCLYFFFKRDELVQTDNLLANFISRRDIQEDPTAPSCLKLANKWLKTCLQEHELCQKILASENKLPTRVIDVGDAHRGPCLCQITNGTNGPYVALSYCWGPDSSKHLKLTKNRLSDFQDQIKWAELPQTLKDAITVTRELGIKFLWIDALCIIQDDREDWRKEAAYMNQVYSNATVTLFAANSSSASHGFLKKRELATECSLPLPFSTSGQSTQPMSPEMIDRKIYVQNRDGAELEIDSSFRSKGPWRTRGWTLQERLSATRGISYTKYQMSWHCLTCVEREDGEHVNLVKEHKKEIAESLNGTIHVSQLTGLSTRWTILTQMKQVYLNEVPDKVYHRLLLREFYNIVNEYKERLFTFQSDKLAATAGVARIMEERLQGADRYYGGLWESNWISGLYWEVSEIGMYFCNSVLPIPEKTQSAPSWSWASVANSKYSAYYDVDTLQSLVTSIEPPEVVNDGERFHPSGPLVLQITAPFIRLSNTWMEPGIQKDDSNGTDLGLLGFERFVRFKLCIEGSERKRAEWYPRSEFSQKHKPYPDQSFAAIKVLVEQRQFNNNLSKPFIFYLILESVKEHPNHYRRVASLTLQQEKPNFKWNLLPATESAIPFVESQGKKVNKDDVLKLIEELPWKTERLQLI